MVIIRTSATEVSIQAVSPELGAHAVKDLSRACRPHDRVDDPVDEIGGNRDFDLELWNKGHGIFGAAVDLGMPFLMAEPLDLGYGHAGDADLRQRILDFIEFEWLDDGDDEFHGIAPG